MKKYSFLIALFFSITSFAYHPSHTDEFEVRYIKDALHLNENVQLDLRSQIPWKSFLQNHPKSSSKIHKITRPIFQMASKTSQQEF